MKSLDWKQILEFIFKFLVPFVPKGWRTIALNFALLLVGLSELVLQDGGIISLLCTHLGIACGPAAVAVASTAAAVLNMLVRTITDTGLGNSEPQK